MANPMGGDHPKRFVYVKSVSNFGPLKEISFFFLEQIFFDVDGWVGGWVGCRWRGPQMTPPRPSSVSNGLVMEGALARKARAGQFF